MTHPVFVRLQAILVKTPWCPEKLLVVHRFQTFKIRDLSRSSQFFEHNLHFNHLKLLITLVSRLGGYEHWLLIMDRSFVARHQTPPYHIQSPSLSGQKRKPHEPSRRQSRLGALIFLVTDIQRCFFQFDLLVAMFCFFANEFNGPKIIQNHKFYFPSQKPLLFSEAIWGPFTCSTPLVPDSPLVGHIATAFPPWRGVLLGGVQVIWGRFWVYLCKIVKLWCNLLSIGMCKTMLHFLCHV